MHLSILGDPILGAAMKPQMRLFLDPTSGSPVLYFYVTCSLIYTSPKSAAYSAMTVYRPKQKKQKDIRKNSKQICLALFLTKCTTPQIHFLMLVTETQSLLWVTDDSNYLGSFDRDVNSLDLVEFGLKRAYDVVAEFLVVYGLVYNPAEGDSIDHKNKSMYDAARAMFSSNSNAQTISKEQLSGLQDGTALSDGLKPFLNFKLYGLLKDTRQLILDGALPAGRDAKGRPKSRRPQDGGAIVFPGYCFYDPEENVTVYFLIRVSISCFLFFFSSYEHSTTLMIYTTFQDNPSQVMVEVMRMEEFVSCQKSELFLSIENGATRDEEAVARDTLCSTYSSGIDELRSEDEEDRLLDKEEEANRPHPLTVRPDYFDNVSDEKTRKMINGMYAEADKSLTVGQYFYF